MRTTRTILALACMLSSAVARSDDWDLKDGGDDDVATTPNELIHGSDQVHDLAGQYIPPDYIRSDHDWYRLRQEGRSSYEVVLDGLAEDFPNGTALLSRTNATGSEELQQSQFVSPEIARSVSLRWENSSAAAVTDQRVRVFAHSPSLDSRDTYHLRAFETTCAIPRFNNSGGQSTVVLIQNPAGYAVSATLWFWSATGTLLASQGFAVAPRGIFSLSTPSLPALVGMSGSITVSHNARYGDLAGKAVSLEPAAGYSFDTPLVHRPR